MFFVACEDLLCSVYEMYYTREVFTEIAQNKYPYHNHVTKVRARACFISLYDFVIPSPCVTVYLSATPAKDEWSSYSISPSTADHTHVSSHTSASNDADCFSTIAQICKFDIYYDFLKNSVYLE